MPTFVATTARGLEPVLVTELREIGAADVVPARGAVRFEGELEVAYRACYFSRVAHHVLHTVATFPVPDEHALYEGVRAVAWEEHFLPTRTIAVSCVASRERAIHTRYWALKTKDAIVDRSRDRTGSRPNVDPRDPDVRVHVHIGKELASLGVDLAGGSLHLRRYRPKGAEAPLKETLAAGVLELAGYRAHASMGHVVCDPMCGSGTLLVEAVEIAADSAPGLRRERFGFERLEGYDPRVLARIREEAVERKAIGLSRVPPVVGFDASEPALELSRESVRRAGYEGHIRLERRALKDAAPPDGSGDGGLVVTNPPYGVRLGETSELGRLYEQLGDVLVRRFRGFDVWVLAGDVELAKHIGLKARRRVPLFNGPIECRLLHFPVRNTAVSAQGPSWRRPSGDAPMFENRLRKNIRKLAPIAHREKLDCYRLYDADIPEYNVAVDRYGPYVVVQENERPRSIEAHVAERHLVDVRCVVQKILDVPDDHVVVKLRKRQREGHQYERRTSDAERIVVREGDLRFWVDLRGYVDTGLFLDHRVLRKVVAREAAGKRFLNLFAYTCTATLHAVQAGAVASTSVDLSNTYLEWGRENFALNDVDPKRHRLVRADCLQFVEAERERYDVIFLNPPSYSRSKGMRGELDLVRDHRELIERTARLLAHSGVLFFATHARSFRLDQRLERTFVVRDISDRTRPPELRKQSHAAFRFELR